MSKRQAVRRGTGMQRVMVGFRVEPATKMKVDRIADALGLSQSQAFELILDQIAIDKHKNVRIGDTLVTTDVEELPLARSA